MEMLGSRLREERKRLGLTQLAFAKIGGVEPNAQGHYESGWRSPKADYLQRMSDAGVDVAYLFSGTSSFTLQAESYHSSRHPPRPTDQKFDRAEHLGNDAHAILEALHRSLSDTTDVIVSVAGCLASSNSEASDEHFFLQATAFRDEAQRFINQAMFRIKCPDSNV